MLKMKSNSLGERARVQKASSWLRLPLVTLSASCAIGLGVVVPTFAQTSPEQGAVDSTAMGGADAGNEKSHARPEPEAQWGGISFYPNIDFGVYYDNNILSEEGNKDASYVAVASPMLSAVAGEAYEEGQLGAHIKADVGSYFDSSEDDYVDITTLLDYDWEPTESLSLYAGFQYIWGHEARGTEGTSGAYSWIWDETQSVYVPYKIDKPSEFEEWGIIGKVGYDLSSGDHIELQGIHENRDYTNNREWTRYRDRTVDRASLGFSHRLGPNTSMIASASVNQYDYAAADLDSTQYGVMVGAKWNITYQTDGFAKVGWGWKEFDSSNRNDSSSFIWEVGVNWRPLSYSTVTVATSQAYDESDGYGDYAVVNKVSADWTHDWYSFLGTSVGASYSVSDWSGSTEGYGVNTVDRQDDQLEYYVRLNYQPWKHLGFGLGWRHTERDSNWDGYDYDDDIFELRVKAGLSLIDGIRSIGSNL